MAIAAFVPSPEPDIDLEWLVVRMTQRLQALGMTQSDLAREMNVSRDAVSKWFNHHNGPKRSSLPKLAAALQTSVAYLLGEERSPDSGSSKADGRAKLYAIADALSPEDEKRIRMMSQEELVERLLGSTDGDSPK